ncbi:MAG: NAD(P)(+) transhydrogenase (Re/Si-specific) subunit alpha [Firmicutes bacterium]|nr:NAD(P)(+) transhydrogenase (Re/Si-specific) subunit alpha [Bacillota bacterium]
MYVAVLPESAAGERRVALVPEGVAAVVRAGHRVGVAAGAGAGAGLADAAYREAGAEVVERPEDLLARADVAVAVRLPAPELVAKMRPGSVLVGVLQPVAQAERIAALARSGVDAYSLDALPRITRAQGMDVLSSMSTVAGYRAVVLAAELSGKFFPLLMTAAGTVAPARVLVLGAGVAGLMAVATARRLGAVVQAFDARPAVREQVESLGASFLSMPDLVLEGAGGYARAAAQEEEAREREILRQPVAAADVVITTAMVPGAPAPRLIDASAVDAMRPQSVIVDLAAEAGGNCERTVPGERVRTEGGVIVVGDTDLVSQMALPASQLFSRNLVAYLQHLWGQGLADGPDGRTQPPRGEDEIVAATRITAGGEVVHAATRERLAAAAAR